MSYSISLTPTGAVTGDFCIAFGVSTSSPVPTAWIGGTMLFGAGLLRGCVYKQLGTMPGDSFSFGVTSTDTNETVYGTGTVLRRQLTPAASAIHAWNATKTVTTTVPCTIFAFSDATAITLTGGTLISTYSNYKLVYIRQAGPGTVTWTATGGTYFYTVAVRSYLEVEIFDGSSWKTGMEIWNGTSWRSDSQIWNGTSWVTL